MRALIAASLLFAALCANAQTIFIARHAERTGEPDPPLNADGQRRAEALSRLLADAGVYYFYTSETIRARQTAEPTARQANRPIEVIEATALTNSALESGKPPTLRILLSSSATVKRSLALSKHSAAVKFPHCVVTNTIASSSSLCCRAAALRS